MGKSTRDTLDPYELFAQAQESTSVPNIFRNNRTSAIQRSGRSRGDYQYVPNASVYDDPESLRISNVNNQPVANVMNNAIVQFGANAVSAFGQGLANTFDLDANAKTIKGLATGSNDNFNSSFMGISTREMQDWANGIAERHEILEKNPGKFDLTDIGWWGKQGASAGTGVGMAFEALAETAGIELATGGLGTAAAIGKLGKLVKDIAKGAKGVARLEEALNASKGLKSAATIYGVMNRLNESRMEATNSYDDIVNTLSQKKNEDGTPKYTGEEIKHLASEGSRRDYYWNLALLPLDILSYRSMVFNPISGSATNWVERGLEGVAGVFGKSKLGKATGWLADKVIATQIEGAEEGIQQFGSDEGKHYAEALGGINDGKTFMQRLGQEVTSDEFWNNYAGGVLGAPIIGGAMNLVNRITTGNRAARLEEEHKNYIREVSKMNSGMVSEISKLEKEGKVEEASKLRRNYSYLELLSRMHLDATLDKTSAYDSKMTFLEATLGELNEGKTDALKDLGFNLSKENNKDQLDVIKEQFSTYIADGKMLKSIYDDVKGKYNRNFVPTIAQDHFILRQLEKQELESNTDIATKQSKIPEFNSLSVQGKEIHDIDYKVQALSLEKIRLNNLYRSTKNNLEKENINKLIESNRTKLTEAKDKLAEIQKDENYTEQDKSKDNDILNSKLHNDDYLQAVYDKENLDNSISLKRKNIALWSNPRYIQEKTKQAIPNAKTKQQVRNNVESTVKNTKKVDPEIVQAAKNKEAEIEAVNIANGADNKVDIGNQELFSPEEYEQADSLMEVNSPISNTNDTEAQDIPDFLSKDVKEFSSSPLIYDFENSSDEAKEKVKNGVGGLLSKLGENPSFEDLVRHFAKLKGLDSADKIYESLKYGYKANGKELSDEEANLVYSKVFGDPTDELMQGASQLRVKNKEELIKETKKVTDEVIAKQDTPDGIDINNQVIYTYKGRVTGESAPKGAFLTRLSKQIEKELEDGTIELDYEYTEDELNTGQYVNSLPVLDPDNYNQGVPIEIKISSNFNEILIPIYLPSGRKGKAMTFGQWVSEQTASRNISLEEFSKTQDYKDKIPMIIYRKGAKSGEKGIMFIHDIGWYHPLRFNQDKPNDMKEAINSTREIREELLNSNNNSVDGTITGKRQTTFEGLINKNKNSPPISLDKANPQTKLAVYKDGEFKQNRSRDNRLFPNNETKLVNNPDKDFTQGQVVEIRRYGLKDGKETYIALPLFKNKIDTTTKVTIYQAISIYADGKNPANQAAVEHIKSVMGLDIRTTGGLSNYLKHFIDVFEPSKNNTNKDVENSATSKLRVGTPYIAFLEGGNIVIGQSGITIYTDTNKKNLLTAAYIKEGKSETEAINKASEEAKVNSLFINSNASFEKSKKAIDALYNKIKVNERNGNKIESIEYPNRLSWYENNMDLGAYAANKPIVTIDKNNTTTITANNYHDYLMSKYTSNIKSYNIGTEENPNYVTNIQPVITYDTNKRLSRETVSGTNVEKAEEVIPTNVVVHDIDEETRKMIEEVEKRLGSDLGASTQYSESPRIIEEDEKEKIAEDIDIIAGLNPTEQSTVTNHIFNEIISRVNFDSGKVTKADIDNEIQSIVEESLLNTKKEDLKEIERLTPISHIGKVQGLINDLKLRISKVDSIIKNYNQLKEIAYIKVDKYTGITNRVEKWEILDSEDEFEFADKNSEYATDFYTDTLTESPENKVTYSMRRFFGNIRQYSKEGNLVAGTLGIPLYTDSSEIIRVLMVNLADVQSNHQSMMDKLETLKDKYTWMQAAINKINSPTLDVQKKNQFVTMMSNTGLRMKHTAIGQDRNGNWNIILQDSNLNGVADMVKKSWRNNIAGDSDFNLLLLDEENNHILNKEKARVLINKFESWVGLSIKTVQNSLDEFKPLINDATKSKSITVSPTGNLLSELKSNLVSKTDRMKFSMFNREYEISSIGNNKFKILILDKKTLPSEEEVWHWLKEFGIELSPKTLQVLLRDGMYHNYKLRTPDSLMDAEGKTNGLFGILYNRLKDLLVEDSIIDFSTRDNPLGDSVINSLAELESQYNTTEIPFGFRVNKKSYFALTPPKFITDRTRDLKNKDSEVRNQLSQIYFSRNSFWLMLLGDNEYREHKYQVSNDSAETLKQTGKKNYKDKVGISDLSDADHEMAKVGKFQPINQGQVTYGKDGSKNYPGTNIPLRMATMAGLTSSDKSIMMDFTTAVLDIQSSSLDDELIKVVYEQLVRPELLRMVQFAKNGSFTNISEYNEGASLFYFIPEMNNLMYSPNLRLIDAIKAKPAVFNETLIENNEQLKKDVYGIIRKHINDLVDEKIKVWHNNSYFKYINSAEDVVNKDGTITTKSKKEIGEIKYFDSKYLGQAKFRGTNEEKVRLAAIDYEINSLIANANNFMLYVGDPALYHKSKSTDNIQRVKDTFENITKRLANQIAPGTTLANSEYEKYIQLFIEDRISTSTNIGYLEKIYGIEVAAPYRDIKGADAQEYTTWKEHLDILTKLGKTPDFLSDITTDDISEARKLLSSGKDLNDKQLEIIRKVMQPLKPVYTGQIYDKNQDVMRTVYIKSSSFPLIPQLTKSFPPINALRLKMEAIEKPKTKNNPEGQGLNVRASHQSANKVGSVNNAAKIWNEDGTINQENLDKITDSQLILDRKNFRIQQEIPYKSDKSKVDTITLGTQLMKLLFGDGVMNIGQEIVHKDGTKEIKNPFILDGKPYTGKELYQEYTNAFIDLINEKQGQLFNELGLDINGKAINKKETITKLQKLLKDEAIKRSYPMQDIKALKLDSNGNFVLPLWASTNSNRYESMLNSIISHRMVALKLPGSSFVTGSEEGFTTKKEESDLTKQEQSDIIFTSAWNGTSLQAQTDKSGELRFAQVFMPSKFRDNEGNLVDLLTQKDKYTEVVDGKLMLKEDMFDKELLSNLSFRIPTSGHQSATKIEVAGFLPHTMGDLIIVPNSFVTQKGLDFDIDKENTYMLWHTMNKDGKFEVLNEKHRKDAVENVFKNKQDKLNKKIEGLQKEAESLGERGREKIENEIGRLKIDFELDKLAVDNSNFNEKLLHNKIIKITRAVYENPSNEMQSKINRTLSTKYAEDQANMIEGLISKNKTIVFSPLSSEYQKQAMLSGASGAIGKGAYSLDVVFHGLAQQVANSGNPLFLSSVEKESEKASKIFRFGNTLSHSELGKDNTIDGSRTNAEVLAERQQIAVDNSSLGIMGKVNLNDLTLDVDKVFTLLGIDKGEDGNSIPFLFLSQPIIREYVNQMKNANSILSNYEVNKEEKLVNSLLTKYDSREELPENYDEIMSNEMTNANFITALSTSNPDGKLQAAVLRRFMEMKQYGIAIRDVQTSINFKNNSLGKSFFDVIERKNGLNKLGNVKTIKLNGEIIGTINNTDKLIGDYKIKSNEDSRPEGYIDIGNYYVKPTTTMGAFNIQATMTAYNLWGEHFPYDTNVMQQTFKQVFDNIGSGDMSPTKTVQTKQEVFKHIKKYLASSNRNGIIGNEDNINNVRRDLYIDSENNISLAKYIKKLLQVPDNKVIKQYIKTNKLINSIELDTKKDGQPSIMRFNNAAGEEFDEQYLYESLSQLLKTTNIELPQIGNKKYTLDTLAQALISYSFIGNSTQEAIQFTKFVPISYLNIIGYSQWLKNNLESSLGLTANVEIPEDQKHLVKEITMQYVQHNPAKVRVKYDTDNWNGKTKDATFDGKKKTLDSLQTFQLVDNMNPTFVSIYNKYSKNDKQQLYWYDGSKYTRVPTLGTFGMDEYQLGQGIGTSIVNGKVNIQINSQPSIARTQEDIDKDPFNVESKSLSVVLDNISKAKIPGMSELVSAITPYIGTTTIDHAIQVGSRKNFNGIYLHDEDAIYINPKLIQNKSLEDKARIIAEEVVHSLTANQIKQYIKQNADGTVDIPIDAPSYVTNLVRLYNNVRSKLDDTKLQDIIRRYKADEGVTKTEFNTQYGFIDIYEFMAQAFVNKEFQNYLARDEFKQNGQTLLDRFKNIIKEILTKLGVNFEANTATAQAFNSIFELIEEEHKNNMSKENQDMKNDIDNREPPEDFYGDDIEASLSFPTKTLNIQDEKCI